MKLPFFYKNFNGKTFFSFKNFKKQIKRIESGTIYKGTPRRITRDLDFREVIYWSHQ